jgi:hypothetical protein
MGAGIARLVELAGEHSVGEARACSMPSTSTGYEVRLWRGGRIPDVAEAVDSPRRLTSDEGDARRVLEAVSHVPRLVWGRDELGTGEMWNSNSIIAWVIARSGLDANSIRPPGGGQAPGWHAGLVVAGPGLADAATLGGRANQLDERLCCLARRSGATGGSTARMDRPHPWRDAVVDGDRDLP